LLGMANTPSSTTSRPPHTDSDLLPRSRCGARASALPPGFGPARSFSQAGGAGDLVAGGFPPKTELLTGPYPYECCQRSDLTPGAIFATTDGTTGDTYRLGPEGPELL
jgi:hypothetical protein